MSAQEEAPLFLHYESKKEFNWKVEQGSWIMLHMIQHVYSDYSTVRAAYICSITAAALPWLLTSLRYCNFDVQPSVGLAVPKQSLSAMR